MTAFRRTLVARALAGAAVLALALLSAPAFAGTTGGLSGTVTDAANGAPIADAKVSVISPSQAAAVQTDASGHFAFVSLAPDEYTVAIEKTGYDSLSYAGVAVFADAQQTLTFTMRKSLRTIANVQARSSSDLVRPGTTADLYSVNAAQQARLSGLGGGGNLNSAYSAISSVPGAYVPANQSGYNQAVHVRGGDSYEVGYEFDGIPVNRAFDNYPSGSLSSLGQLELQVYTGATPSNAEAQGLAGFINQVIKTGTFPGYASFDGALGSTVFYHSLNVEAGGATPDRMFSYYVGLGGFNQQHRYVDQFGGAAYANEFGQQLTLCPVGPKALAQLPSCFTGDARNTGQNGTPGWVLGPIGFGTANPVGLADRTSVLNFHVAIPHKSGGLRDDVQLLYDNDEIFTTFFSSPNDEGLANWNQSVKAFPPYWLDSFGYTGKLGSLLPSNYASLVQPYFYPSSPAHPLYGAIGDPYNNRDVGYNGQAIVKLQYQKNFSPSAFMRLYGYTYYSNWIENGPMMSLQPYAYYDSGDYEINNHTRGVSLSFTDQISPQHLLEAEGSYTTATGARIYNEQMFGYGDSFAVLVNPNAITSGTCYAAPSTKYGAATPTTCSDFGGSGVTYGNTEATFASLSGIYNGSLPPTASNYTCGGVKCAYYVVENGTYGLNNTVKPAFAGYSLTDQWRPGDKWNVNLGIRVDNYSFIGSNTDTGPARDFWFATFNQDTCYDKATLTLVDRTALLTGKWSTNSQVPCSAFGPQYVNAALYNTPTAFDYNIVQPRVGLTYTVDQNTVLRASYGKYNEQPSSAYEQYNGLEQNLPDTLTQFYSLGFNTPGHAVAPSISFNSDLSIEHHFKGTDMSFKLSPFLRQTQNQVENFYINYATGLTSGLNAGNQTSSGFEFQFNKGDFNRNGFSGQLSFAYTYVTVKYNNLPNGTTILSAINSGISQYNAYTKACAPNGSEYGKKQFGQPVCGYTSQGAGSYAARCYTPHGQPDPGCGPNSIANPYWNSPAFPLDDPTASYLPYSVFPGPVGSGVNAYNYPYVATLLLNYKHDKFAITPSLQYQAGNRYGAPLVWPGIDPASGCGLPLTGSTAGDPRYPYGSSGGSPYNADHHNPNLPCAASLSIPDPYTGNFDAVGAFREPAQLLGNLQISYQATPRVTFTATLANLLQTCFGGQQTKFTYFWGNNVCIYTNLVGGPSTPPAGNAYNPHDNVQTFLRYPYEPYFGAYNDLSSSLNQPFNAYFSVKVKI